MGKKGCKGTVAYRRNGMYVEPTNPRHPPGRSLGNSVILLPSPLPSGWCLIFSNLDLHSWTHSCGWKICSYHFLSSLRSTRLKVCWEFCFVNQYQADNFLVCNIYPFGKSGCFQHYICICSATKMLRCLTSRCGDGQSWRLHLYQNIAQL